MNGRVSLPIFTYHSLDDSGSVTSTDPTMFVDTMARLIEAGFECVDWSTWRDGGAGGPAKPFALTFDDGDASILKVADVFPKLGLTATIFLVADHVGRTNDWPGRPDWVPVAPQLDWSEAVDLRNRGFTFGSHSRTHPDLTKIGPHRLRDELRGAREAIEERLSVPCRLFAYPYGRVDEAVKTECRQHYECAFGTRLSACNPWDDAHELPRIDAYYLKSGPLLDHILTGNADGWLRRRSRLRVARAALRWGRVG